MFKKNLITGILPALLVLFALTGCSSPTDGSPGGIGLAQLSGAVSAEQLAESFAVHDVIQLDSSGTPSSVEGLVPAGKVLIIAGPAQITAAETLTINGSVEIRPTASFNTATGILAKESAGTIFTRGELVLAAQYYEYPIIVSRTSFDSAGVLSLPGANATAINEFFATPGINNIKNDTITLRPAQVNTLTNWTGAKKLILVTAAITNGFDVSAETLGQLVLDSGATVTIPSGEVLKAQAASANVTVARGAKIILPDAVADKAELAGKIIINGGTLSVVDNATTFVIPTGDVDLTNAILTKEGTSNPSTIAFPAAAVEVARIEVPDELTITGTSSLKVGVITGTAGEALTLPGVAVVVDEIELPTGTLTIDGPAGSPGVALSPAKVSGAPGDELVFTNTVVLSGPIDLSATITAGLANLGTAAPDQLVQLAKITGGTVNLPAITFNGTDQASSIFSTIIAVDSDDITIAADTTFREGFQITTSGKIANTVTGVTLTLGADSSSVGGLDVGSGGGLTVTGSGDLTLAGNLVVAGPTTFNGGDITLGGGANTINAKLTIGAGTIVTTAGGLIFTAGTYTGTGVTVNAGTITVATATTDQLILGDNAVTEKLLTLAATGVGTGTFILTGADANAILSGTGNGAIVVTPTSTSTADAVLTVGATAELKLGDGIIALGYGPGSYAGTLALTASGAKLSGFTFNGTTLQINTDEVYQPSFTTNPGESVLGNYYTGGIAITHGSGAYAYDDTTTFVGTITGNGTSYAAREIHGGIIRKTSDVAK
jgi:hypothetical protein